MVVDGFLALRLEILAALTALGGLIGENRKYRTLTAEQKIEIVLAAPRGDQAVRDVCRTYEISDALFYQWRERLLEASKTALAQPRDKKPPDATGLPEAKKKIAQLERTLGRKTYELDVAGEALPHD